MDTWKTQVADHIGDRPEQQDRVVALANEDTGAHLLVVIDGVGGQRGGALAAQAVADTARELWKDCFGQPAEPEEFLQQLISEGHRAIDRVDDEGDRQPRATMVALLLDGKRASWVHSGDSRLYHFRNGELIGRTRDHSVLQILVEQGKVREEDMGTHPDQGRLLQSLGGDTEPEPEIESEELKGGEAFVLCTDGFWERFTPEQMIRLLSSPEELDRWLPLAAEEAVRRADGNSDNVSVAVAVSARSGIEGVGRPRYVDGTTTPARGRRFLGKIVLALALPIIGAVAWYGWNEFRTSEDAEGDRVNERGIPGVEELGGERVEKPTVLDPGENMTPAVSVEGEGVDPVAVPIVPHTTPPETVDSPSEAGTTHSNEPVVSGPEGTQPELPISLSKVESPPLPKFILIPVSMGEVEVAFRISRYEISKEQYDMVMGEAGEQGATAAPEVEGATFPVSGVSYGEAVEFCRQLTKREREAGRLPDGLLYRLPSLAEFQAVAFEPLGAAESQAPGSKARKFLTSYEPKNLLKEWLLGEPDGFGGMRYLVMSGGVRSPANLSFLFESGPANEGSLPTVKEIGFRVVLTQEGRERRHLERKPVARRSEKETTVENE